MTDAETKIINEEIAKTYELFNLEMSFQEYKDIFELGARFGHALAKVDLQKQDPEVGTFDRPDVTVWELKREKVKSHQWLAKILR